MSDYQATAIVLTTAVVIFSILYVFSDFTYTISDGTLKMKWSILKFVFFGSRKVNIDNINEVKLFDFRKDILKGYDVFGNLLIKKGVVIILKKRSMLLKRIYITPGNPDKFIEQINQEKAKYEINKK